MRNRSGSIELFVINILLCFPARATGRVFYCPVRSCHSHPVFRTGGSVRDGKVPSGLFRIRNRGCQSRMSGHRAAKSGQDLSARLLARLLAHDWARYRGREWDQYSCKPAIPITRCAEFMDIIRRFSCALFRISSAILFPLYFSSSAREKIEKKSASFKGNESPVRTFRMGRHHDVVRLVRVPRRERQA